MYLSNFPPCQVEGPILPAIPDPEFPPVEGYPKIFGTLPQKCGSCHHVTKDGCSRFLDLIGYHLSYDFGRCHVLGPTHPVQGFRGLHCPAKCLTCEFYYKDRKLGPRCGRDPSFGILWSFDWGDWKPPFVKVCLQDGKKADESMMLAAFEGRELDFVSRHRVLNPESSDAGQDYLHVRTVQKELAHFCEPPLPPA